MDGNACVVVEERLSESWEGQTRQLWIDPARGNVVVRSRHTVRDKSDCAHDYDIEYDAGDTGLWLPRTISVLRMSPLGDPLDAISIARIGARSQHIFSDSTPDSGAHNVAAHSNESTDFLAWEPRPGTWVDDYIENKQYFVRTDGSRRSIAFKENYAGLSYQDLVAEETDAKSWNRLARTRIGRSILVIAVKACTWPGILLTLPAAFLIGKTVRIGYIRIRRQNLGRLNAC